MSNSGTHHAWKRPISRIYLYNLDVGENYYMPMTTYLDNKASLDSPGALSFRYGQIYLIIVTVIIWVCSGFILSNTPLVIPTLNVQEQITIIYVRYTNIINVLMTVYSLLFLLISFSWHQGLLFYAYLYYYSWRALHLNDTIQLIILWHFE